MTTSHGRGRGVFSKLKSWCWIPWPNQVSFLRLLQDILAGHLLYLRSLANLILANFSLFQLCCTAGYVSFCWKLTLCSCFVGQPPLRLLFGQKGGRRSLGLTPWCTPYHIYFLAKEIFPFATKGNGLTYLLCKVLICRWVIRQWVGVSPAIEQKQFCLFPLMWSHYISWVLGTCLIVGSFRNMPDCWENFI